MIFKYFRVYYFNKFPKNTRMQIHFRLFDKKHLILFIFMDEKRKQNYNQLLCSITPIIYWTFIIPNFHIKSFLFFVWNKLYTSIFIKKIIAKKIMVFFYKATLFGIP